MGLQLPYPGPLRQLLERRDLPAGLFPLGPVLLMYQRPRRLRSEAWGGLDRKVPPALPVQVVEQVEPEVEGEGDTVPRELDFPSIAQTHPRLQVAAEAQAAGAVEGVQERLSQTPLAGTLLRAARESRAGQEAGERLP